MGDTGLIIETKKKSEVVTAWPHDGLLVARVHAEPLQSCLTLGDYGLYPATTRSDRVTSFNRPRICSGFPGPSGEEPTCQCRRPEAWAPSLGRGDAWRRACKPTALTWRIPQTEEPGGLQSTGSQRVRRD